MGTVDILIETLNSGKRIDTTLISMAEGESPWWLDSIENYHHLDKGHIEGTELEWGVFEADGKTYKVVWEYDSYSISKNLRSVKEVRPTTKKVMVYDPV
ncbi:MAG: hypothetical protein GOVbin4162_59 [Prokaryotic dsDNA virus sp.]|nr:MAG: hypothetical protein GOVbin4162_59 [Prokaryotic dsDNA virus sp.]|tara:strand:- start:6106 stop:6402 length:297 start_codon:yes stop_codon:yes gene_type:complete